MMKTLDKMKRAWGRFRQHSWTVESETMLKLGGPVMATFMLQYLLQLVNMFVIGHAPGMKETGLAAAALGNMYSNFTGIAVTLGLSTAIDTLAAQAFGAKNYPRVGIVVQRGALYLTAVCIPVAFLWWYCGHILIHLKQEEDVVDYAGDYVRISIIGLWPLVMFEVAKKFLQVQNLTVPPMIAVGVGIVTNAILAYTFVFHTELGFYGAPLALAVAEWTMFLSMMMYIWYFNRYVTEVYGEDDTNEDDLECNGNPRPHEGRNSCFAISEDEELWDDLKEEPVEDSETPEQEQTEDENVAFRDASVNGNQRSSSEAQEDEQGGRQKVFLGKTWEGFTFKEATSGWKEFTLLALPGAVQLTIEWGTFEVLALFAGMVGTTALATHSILSMSGGAMFMFPLGLSVAVGIRVGHATGDQRPEDAKLSTYVGCTLGVVYSVLNAIVILCARNYWGLIFSPEKGVVDLTAKTLPILAVFNLFDANQCVLSGMLRGVGRQAFGALLNFISYCMIGLPLAYLFSNPWDLKLRGVWSGDTVGAAIASALLIVTALRQDWKGLAREAYKRSATYHSKRVSEDG